MADQEYFLGSVGPLYYDDTDTYPDAVTHRGLRAPQIYIEDAPASANEVLRQGDLTYSGTNFKITSLGGYAVKLVAGEALAEGEVVYVRIAGGTDGKVWKNPIDGDMPIGVVYADAALDADVWIVVAGIAYVLPEAGFTATRGYLIYSSDATAGRVDEAATLPAVAAHNREIGHWLDTGSGNGVKTRAIIHFN